MESKEPYLGLYKFVLSSMERCQPNTVKYWHQSNIDP